MPGRNGIVGLVCLSMSVWLLFLTGGLPPAIMVPIGPAFYPRLVLSFMAVLSVLLIVMDWRVRRSARSMPAALPRESPAAERPNYILVVATFIEFGLYVALLPLLGFRIATLLFVAVLQITLDWPRTGRRWLLVMLVAIGTTVICDVAFEQYLLVLLPRGAWTGM